MSLPLRKDEFDTEELTTADLAQGKRPVATEDRPGTEQMKTDQMKTDLLKEERTSENRPSPVLAERPSDENVRSTTSEGSTNTADNRNPADTAPLFPTDELQDLRTRWGGVQTAFVDEPRRAVEQADGLVASAMKRLAEVFAEERSKLEKQWDRGDDVSTEDLRIALQRYRSFFQRLLSI